MSTLNDSSAAEGSNMDETQESVSDSEVDLNRDVFDDTPGVKVSRRGVRYWGTVVRRSSIGWFSTSTPTNQSPSNNQPTDRVIDLLRTPSVQTFTTLKKKLNKAKNRPEWILHFLSKDGLGLLFESLQQLCNKPSGGFLNTILQVSCVECVRAVMDTSLGLDYIVDNKEFTEKLAKALDTDNVTLKIQVLELLAALCVYSKDGYTRAIDAIECHKVAKRQKYRFAFIVEELRNAETLQYKTVLLECINCVIIYSDKINDRVRIRNEFYGLKLQEVLNQLRKVAEKDTNLETQLDVFEEHRANDDEQLPGAKGIDLTSSLDVFHAIYKQVSDTPQEIHFLTVLQDLLKIDNAEKTAEIIWETVENLVSKATVIESPEDSRKLLLSFTKRLESDGVCMCACHKEDGADRRRVMSPRRTSGVQSDGKSEDQARVTSPPNTPGGSSVAVAPPPPPPPPPGIGGAPPPPPPPPPPGGGPPPPPPPPGSGGGILGFFKKSPAKLPQQNIPKPKTKMRTLQWQKIPANKVVGKSNLWTMTGKMFNGYVSQMDYAEIENLFSVSKPKVPGEDQTDSPGGFEKKKKENAEDDFFGTMDLVNILDGKRSLNVNIFLKQFKMSNEEIIQLLQDGQSDKFGAEKLRSLQKILPSQEEIDLFRSFDGDRSKLGSAEKFFMCLMGLPNYRLRVEGLVIKEEFNANMDYIRPSIDSIIEAAKDIKENKNLHELLYLVLLSGNYINAGNYAGDAAGFKLTSLLKLTETRANKPRMNLMHYVVLQAEEKNPSLLTFTDDMKFLNNAAQVNLDSLTSDIRSLDEKVSKIKSNIDSVGSDFKRQMKGFIEIADKDLSDLNEDLKDIESLRLELADFFCEDDKQFKLEECFKVFHTFCERFNKAKLENNQRKEHEAKMEARRLQREAELQSKNSVEVTSPDNSTDDDTKGSILDKLLADVRSGFKKYGETSFSVTKVHKINIDSQSVPNESVPSLSMEEASGNGSFVRGGTGRRSLRNKRNKETGVENTLNVPGDRNSYAVDTDDTLFDILMSPEENTKKDEGTFARIGSLRRRRSDRMQKRSGMLDHDRERAASPNIEATKKEVIEMKERPKSDILDDNFDYRQGANVRRSRSLYDRASSDSPRRSSLDTNNNKSEGNLTIDRSQSPAFRLDDPTRRSSRWRSDINEISSLPKIEENFKDNAVNTRALSGSKDDSDVSVGLRGRGKMERRLSQEQIQRVLETAEDVKNKTDEHSNISLSVRTKLNKRWHSELDKSDIDNVLKAIEETGKQIDDIGISKPKTEPTPASVNSETDSDTGSVSRNAKAPVDTKVVPQGDQGEPDVLKVKRNKRKQRDTLSMDDIHAAFKSIDTVSPSVTEKKEKASPSPSKSPKVPPRRSRTSSQEKVEATSPHDNKSQSEKEQMSKAAKLAGKKRFRDQRFGDKDTPSQKAMLDHSQGRWKSDVEKDNVDEAIRDYMSKNSMSRSKSYDEAVARKAISEDGRRNGHVWTDEDSDTETMTPGSSTPRRPSSTASTRSDSPKSSSSRLSVKSLNNSTETLRETCTDGENSPEQKRRESSVSDGDKCRDTATPSPSFSNKLGDGNVQARSSTPPVMQHELFISNKQDGLKQYENKKPFDENDDLPVAQMLKWRKKRDEKRRRSFYDNVSDIESGNLSPKGHEGFRFDGNVNSPRSEPSMHGSLQTFHKTQGSNELHNETGSRCSYASSSDSASRDEGFESQSGTQSQRTSLSSTLESEFIHQLTKKAEPMSRLQINETIIAAGARSSVNDTKKQRTESWTEAVAINAVHITSDDSIDYSVTSPDSGNETMKDEVWTEQSDLESTLKNDSRPMSPLSTSSGSTKKEKKVPSYMRSTNSSSKRKSSASEAEPSPSRKESVSRPPSRLSRGPSGLSSQSLNKSKAGSNSSIVSITSNASDAPSNQPVKKRVSHGGRGERPNSMHLSTPSSRTDGAHVPVPRSKTPSVQPMAHKPAAHPTSTIGGRTTNSYTIRSNQKSKPAPPPPTGRTAKSSTTPTKSSTSSTRTPSSTPSRPASTPPIRPASTPPIRPASTTPTRPASTTPRSSTTTPRSSLGTPRSSLGTPRSTTPNPTRTRPVGTPTRSVTPSFRSTTPTIEEVDEDPNAPSPLKRSQSVRISSANRPSFMSPTAASKARKDKLKAEESPPPTPPPRRSKDTDSLPHKTDVTPSPLKRHSSLRLPSRAVSKTGKESAEKSGDNKLKGFIQKIGGSGSKVRPEADTAGKLAPVAEGSEKDAKDATGDEATNAKEGGRSPSLRKILGLKAKDKTVRKSTDSLKSDSSDKKRKGSK